MTVDKQHEGAPFLEKMVEEVTPPKDKGKLVYLIVLLNGIGVLLPWNMFITIAPQYYVDYWFSPNGNQSHYATSFMSTLGMASQFPNLAINVANIFFVIGGSLLIRIAGPLVINCVSISVVVSLIALVHPTIDAMGWFYITTLVIVAIINFANGLYQNSIFGMFADFPAEYTNALILGNNICGTFTTVLNITASLVFGENIRLIALIYFSISLLVLLACGFSLYVLVRQEFYQFFVRKGDEARAAEGSTKPSFAQIFGTMKECGVQLFNVFFIFFVTLTIFPAMLVATPYYQPDGNIWDSIWPENLYVSVTTFLVFNVFATVGSVIANFIQWPSPKYLLFPVLLRGLLVPFFMFCNYRPLDRKMPVFFKSEFSFLFAAILMATSSGYFSSLAMMYAPRVVHPSKSKIAGMTAALCLITGIFAGVSFTFVIAAITTA